MQSCPNCGTRNRPEARICQMCGAALVGPAAAIFNSMAGNAPLDGVSRENSLDGHAPQAPSSSQAAADGTRSGNESWGPGTWGPGGWRSEVPASSEPPSGAANSTIAPTPGADQPPALREYGTGATWPRPGGPYRPPRGPGGPAAPGYPGPGYPLIPQGGRAPVAPGYPVVPGGPAYRGYAPAPAYAPYPPYPGAPGYPYGWYPFIRPPRAPGETYHKVLSILTIVASSLLLLGGLGILGVLTFLILAGEGQDLYFVTLLGMFALAALAGGGAGLYHGIRALMRRASAPFSLPSFWLLLAVTVVILGTGLALFAARQPTGPLALIEPLVLLSGIVPAFTVLAVGLQKLDAGTSWRRAWLALTSGATLAIGAAGLIELVFTLLLLGALNLSSLDPTNFNPTSSPGVIVAVLLIVAVIAPLVEETTKQISGFFLLPRIKGPQEAFLIGMASGIGFAMVETAGYIGMSQADWIGIALGRVGAGLLHGMGAAMAGLGWYYLIKGKGMRRRRALGFGCLAYAYVQHAIFNGGAVLLFVLFPSLQNWQINLFDLSLDATTFYAVALYIIILVVLLIVTDELRRSAPPAVSDIAIGAPTSGGAMAARSAAGASFVENQPASQAMTDASGSREWDNTESGKRL